MGTSGNAIAPPRGTAGEAAERLVHERVHAALPAEYRLYSNVTWIGRTAGHRGLRDGEADLVIAHPDKGFLVLEVKAGEIARDAHGCWFAGHDRLDPSPFEQARANLQALLDKLRSLPEAPPNWHPIAGHAVAFPGVDLASAGGRLRLMGPDVEPNLILDIARHQTSDRSRPRAVCPFPRSSDENEATVVPPMAVVRPGSVKRIVVDGSGFLERHPMLGQVGTRLVLVPLVPRHRRTVATGPNPGLTS